MTEVIIDKKKYFIIPQKDYENLQKKAALKIKPQKLYSVADAREYSKQLISQWAEEPLQFKKTQ